jgi:hypothetical protein
VHEYEGLDFEELAYIAPGPPLPISVTLISTMVTPLTTAGNSTPRRLLTDDDRRRMYEYHESYLGKLNSISWDTVLYRKEEQEID